MRQKLSISPQIFHPVRTTGYVRHTSPSSQVSGCVASPTVAEVQARAVGGESPLVSAPSMREACPPGLRGLLLDACDVHVWLAEKQQSVPRLTRSLSLGLRGKRGGTRPGKASREPSREIMAAGIALTPSAAPCPALRAPVHATLRRPRP